MNRADISRRDALLAAALECVAEKGFEGMRLRDVADRAGIEHSTLHHHFATKETLVEALVTEVVGRFRPTMPAAGVPRQRLHDHLTGLAALIVKQPMLFAVMSELDQRPSRLGSSRSAARTRARLANGPQGTLPRTSMGTLCRR